MYDESVPPALGPRNPYPTLEDPQPRRDPGDLSTYLDQVVVKVNPDASNLDLDISCISAWHPGGEPHSLWENLGLHEALRTRAVELDPGARSTAVHAPDHSWAEQAMALRERADALLLAQEFDAPAIVT